MRQRLKQLWENSKNNPRKRKFISRLYNLVSRNKYFVQGNGNRINWNDALLMKITMDVIGDNNTIEIGKGCRISNTLIRVRGNGHRITLGENCSYQGGNLWVEDDHCVLKIGDGTTVVEAAIGVTEPGSKIEIGPECMFAHGIELRSGDSHSIINSSNGERINYAKDIRIGKHVWLAADVMVLKGVEIGDECVVASRSLVTKSFSANSLIGGSPAVLLRENITWDRKRFYKKAG